MDPCFLPSLSFLSLTATAAPRRPSNPYPQCLTAAAVMQATGAKKAGDIVVGH